MPDIERLAGLARDAGEAILQIRRSGALGTRLKTDASPVTAADEAADRVIAVGLAQSYPDIPVISEERAASHTLTARRFFLVDPLDGTKDFARGGPDFTVNIALVEDGIPVQGVVFAPASGRLFRTTARGALEETPDGPHPLRVQPPGTPLRIVASKSHRNPDTEAFLARYPGVETRAAGSSLKFCLIAAGEADLYPRLGRTMEWDTAAADAILRAAGGEVLRLDDGTPLRYGKLGLDNPHFLARTPDAPWHKE